MPTPLAKNKHLRAIQLLPDLGKTPKTNLTREIKMQREIQATLNFPFLIQERETILF